MGKGTLRQLIAMFALMLSLEAPVAAQITSTSPLSGGNPLDVGKAAASPKMIPANTSVLLRVESPVSSRTALRGDKFDISLAQDITVDGRVVVPLGSYGKGEVIHVQGRGFGGRAGELLLAARFIEFDGRQLRLRGFAVAKAGANNTAEALAIPIAGLFITGTSAEVKVGHIGRGTTVEDFELPAILPGSTTIREPAK